jgi:hypothetical protein
MQFLLSRNVRLVTIWLSVVSLPIHEACELRLGQSHQRADRFRFDVEHPRHRVELRAFVSQA